MFLGFMLKNEVSSVLKWCEKVSKKDSLGHLSKYSSYKCLIDFLCQDVSYVFFFLCQLSHKLCQACTEKSAPSVVSEEDMVSKDKC